MRGRLMVGHHPLKVTILVRIQAPQQNKKLPKRQALAWKI